MDVLHPVVPQKSSQRNLAIGIGISLGLHLAISALLLGTPQGPPAQGSISFLDLKNVQFPSEAAPPAPAKPAPPRSEEFEPAPVTEKPTPETAPPPPDAATTQQQEQPAAAGKPTPQEQIANTSLGLGMSKGYFSSIGKGESLRDGVREYYLGMLEQVNQRWWLDQGVDKRQIGPLLVNLVVARDGQIMEVQLVASSGNPQYDKAVLKALEGAGPFAPLPAEYRDAYFLAPLRLFPPLNLMAW